VHLNIVTPPPPPPRATNTLIPHTTTVKQRTPYLQQHLQPHLQRVLILLWAPLAAAHISNPLGICAFHWTLLQTLLVVIGTTCSAHGLTFFAQSCVHAVCTAHRW
jgi:hypothetical protein